MHSHLAHVQSMSDQCHMTGHSYQTMTYAYVCEMQVEEGRDFCIVQPLAPENFKSGVAIDTYDDHRMAMCFSLAACGGKAVTINDPGCTSKTFPTYFKVLEGLTTKA